LSVGVRGVGAGFHRRRTHRLSERAEDHPARLYDVAISEALSADRQRLGSLLTGALDTSSRDALAQLLVPEDTLSELAALRQDAKNFRWQQMAREREKRAKLEPIYRVKALLPSLAISQ
jgi:hypothetical protein